MLGFLVLPGGLNIKFAVGSSQFTVVSFQFNAFYLCPLPFALCLLQPVFQILTYRKTGCFSRKCPSISDTTAVLLKAV
jgi:hypothetical protein